MPSSHAVSGARRAVLSSTSTFDTGRLVVLPHDGVVTLGRNAECTVQVAEPSVSGKHAMILREADGYVVHDMRSLNGTYVNERAIRRAKLLVNGDCLRLGTKATLRFTWMEAGERDALTRLYERALYDPLTGVTNRHELDRRLDVALAQTGVNDLAVVVADLDFFKQLNDEHGHLAGDAVLRAAAQQMLRVARAEDLVARFGGEEFVVMLPNATKGMAVDLAEAMRTRIASLEEQWVAPRSGVDALGARSLRITASFGVAMWSEARPANKAGLLAAADRRLYRAKSEGRNRVVACD